MTKEEQLMDGAAANKIAFISCVNNNDQFAECVYYLDQLILPDGFEKDVITIQDAPSMAAGYNAGMESSDAKYKVYLHQDVHILNSNFIADICNIFQPNPDVGMIGCVGTTDIGKEAIAIGSWDTGKVIQNWTLLAFNEPDTAYTPVMALDGLLLATQYDILWREDLMDGWDFYDISQCMEFTRAGYQVVVPRQQDPWCYHDSNSSNLKNYDHYRKRFINEYHKGEYVIPPECKKTKEYQDLEQTAQFLIEQLICAGNHTQLHEIFQNPANRGFMHLVDYKIIADIDYLECQSNTSNRLWQTGMDAAQLLQRVRQLKFWLLRIEYRSADTFSTMNQIMDKYSIYAVVEMFVQFTLYKEHTYKEITTYLEQKNLVQERAVWELIKNKI